ncbi:ribonuclease HII [Patescibacteria group bacterium]
MDSLDFDHEQELWDENFKYLAGFDEVGRGAFSGPVVVGCVGFRSDTVVPKGIYLNDSKALTQKRRETACAWVIENSSFYGLGQTENDYVDIFGISRALFAARQMAYDQASDRLRKHDKLGRINKVLVDGKDNFYLSGLRKDDQLHIIRGDAIVASIAAASIVAKVYRDALMRSYSYHPDYEVYDWFSNKGYGTAKHRDAIAKHGPSRLHRKEFIKKYV